MNEAAVVRGEKEEGVLTEAEPVEGGADGADALVEFFEEAGILRAAGVAGHGGLFFVFGDAVRGGGEGDVDCGVGDLEQEGVIGVCFDEGDGFFGEELGGLAGVGAARDGGRLGVAVGFEGGLPALIGGGVAFASEVPFSEVTGVVAFGAEAFGEGDGVERKFGGNDGVDEASVGSAMTGDVLGDAEAGLVLPGLEVGAGG